MAPVTRSESKTFYLRNNNQPPSSRFGLQLSAWLLLSIFCQPGFALEDILFEETVSIPDVLTPVRLKQSRAEAPGSISVITKEMIKATGLRELAEILRLVPGMVVAPYANYEHRVSYHGTNSHESRRMQVLVDGRSVYQPAVASVKWTNIPISIEDIERIEVIRGPASASYGANSFLGAINIITVNPQDSLGWQVSTTRGRREIEDYYARYGGKLENSSYRFTYASQHDSGFDVFKNGEPQRDDKDYKSINYRHSFSLNRSNSLDFQLGLKKGTNQRPIPSGDEDLYLSYPDADLESRFVSLKYEREMSRDHSYRIQIYHRELINEVSWKTCVPSLFLLEDMYRVYQIDPDFADSLLGIYAGGGLPTSSNPAISDLLTNSITPDVVSLVGSGTLTSCGIANEDYKQQQSDIEFQDTYRFNDQFRLVSGISAREDAGDSETYLGGIQTNTSARAFANLEWKPLQKIVMNIGGMYEWERENDNAFSPRFAVNYRITPQETLRFNYSEAIRTPDSFEQDAYWSYTVHQLDPPVFGKREATYYVRARGPGKLKNEHARSREVGYHGQFAKIGMAVDVRFFWDHYTRLISDNLTLTGFDPDNNSELKQYGGEFEVDYTPKRGILLRVAYAHIDNTLITRLAEDNLTPHDSGSLLASYELNEHWNVGVGYYYANDLNHFKFSRADYRATYTTKIGDVATQITAVIQHRYDDDPILYSNNVYEDKSQGYISLSLKF